MATFKRTPLRMLTLLLAGGAIGAPAMAEELAGMAGAANTTAPAAAGNSARKPGFWELLHDPTDGKIDASRWLLERKGGFLPVPIIITDPAVGNGGGVALAFFRPNAHPAAAADSGERPAMVSPDIYGAMAMRTSNGTQAFGAGALLHFDEDRWRYRGGVGKASINLDFHSPGNRLLPPRQISYTTEGIASFQQVFHRLGKRDLYVGLAWIYMDMDLSFKTDSDREFFSDRELASKTSGLGLSLEYDNRDNPFTPSRGWLAMVEGNAYAKALGSDADFQSYRAHSYGYLPLGASTVLGLRADARWVNGQVPFYRLPYIDMRGIGSARYQDSRAATVETELRWNLGPRWALVGFVGAGRTWGRHTSFGDGSSRVSKGGGFRYLLVRQLGMYAGIDYAWGPEDETFYIQMGSAWR
ncbi:MULTISPECIES: BamA/TamA family outer membrane protein [Stenotrophomonas]|uniref:BamA/TamA family outer membrane protein n=1 Tax=Stenotrophomonas TaxID=40323 RepID=UPI0007700B1F|nr:MULTISPECIES: BamA/TamA family outer membrane protein [Stenotrophomonas]AMJ55306.1 hypothetical protein AXG53_00650 [Stenotrophomonas sp. KCTC 12332]